jgi:hypothetical protein
VTTELAPELAATIKEAFDRRDRANMLPMIDFFEQLLTEHPDNPHVLYEVGGSYERALPGLSGETRRKCLLQYGNTLRNLDRLDESLEVFEAACVEFPGLDSLRVFKSLTLHAAVQEPVVAGLGEPLAPVSPASAPVGAVDQPGPAARPGGDQRGQRHPRIMAAGHRHHRGAAPACPGASLRRSQALAGLVFEDQPGA